MWHPDLSERERGGVAPQWPQAKLIEGRQDVKRVAAEQLSIPGLKDPAQYSIAVSMPCERTAGRFSVPLIEPVIRQQQSEPQLGKILVL